MSLHYTKYGLNVTKTGFKYCMQNLNIQNEIYDMLSLDMWERVGILLTGLTLSQFCACPKPGPGFPTSYIMVFFVFNELRVRRGDCSLLILG